MARRATRLDDAPSLAGCSRSIMQVTLYTALGRYVDEGAVREARVVAALDRTLPGVAAVRLAGTCGPDGARPRPGFWDPDGLGRAERCWSHAVDTRSPAPAARR